MTTPKPLAGDIDAAAADAGAEKGAAEAEADFDAATDCPLA